MEKCLRAFSSVTHILSIYAVDVSDLVVTMVERVSGSMESIFSFSLKMRRKKQSKGKEKVGQEKAKERLSMQCSLKKRKK
jgi:hypothetical protein